MRIQLICPARAGTLHGNRVTAARWARILRGLGHRVRIAQSYDGGSCDALVALHARRSAEAVLRFRRRYPGRPVVVTLTGTDVYRDLRRSPKGSGRAWRAVELATRLVVLQPLAARELPRRLRKKVRVIYQSAEKTRPRVRPRRDVFEVCVVGHLRAVKDPFRAARASRLLPAASRLRVLHLGTAMEPGMARRARAEERRNPRYRWLGGVSYERARRRLAGSRLLVLSSRLEGGANVISEAVVDAVPVVASRIPGTVGLLGGGYPGYFAVGDPAGRDGLARLLARAESDPRFYARLKSWCARRARLFRAAQERARWRQLLREVTRVLPARVETSRPARRKTSVRRHG
jgi:putative glycosyltransferase (TIGR04348 family)